MNNKDYVRLMEIRTIQDTPTEEMVVEGKAVTFNERTKLFTYEGNDYYEIIDRGAFEATDISNCYFKYNHSDNIMVMARTKNNTLKIDVRSDGVYIKATLADTQSAKDVYSLIKRGDIDKMSFAFNITEQSYNDELRTWTVRKIGKLFDVAVVPVPAYENTNIYASRMGDVNNNELEKFKEIEKNKKQALAKVRAKLLKF